MPVQYSGLLEPALKQMSPVVPVRLPCAVVPSDTHKEVVLVSLKMRRKCVDCTTVLILIAGAAAPVPVKAMLTPAPAFVEDVEELAMVRPAPVVRPLRVILIALPVVSVAEVTTMRHAVVAAVGCVVGCSVGCLVGCCVGCLLGCPVGCSVG